MFNNQARLFPAFQSMTKLTSLSSCLHVHDSATKNACHVFHLLRWLSHVHFMQKEVCDPLVLWNLLVCSGRSALDAGYVQMYHCTVKVFHGNVCLCNGRVPKTLIL
jgi:hypothetical protein